MATKTRSLILAVSVLTLLSACNNGGSSYSSPTTPPTTGTGPTATNAISITGIKGSNSFSPNPASAKVATSVQWKNADTATHHIVSDTPGAFDTGNIASGSTSAAMTVNQTGSYPYHCTIHPSMTGTLNVTQ